MTNYQWEAVYSRAKVAFNYGIEKSERLNNNPLAKLIVATPFLAHCDKPLETAFSHLAIYLLSLDETAKYVYFHKPEDDADYYSRLKPILNFSGGDQDILDCSRDLITLCMIANYRKDAESDRLMGKYNPINEAGWNYDVISEKLIRNIRETITPEIENIYTITVAEKGYWQNSPSTENIAEQIKEKIAV